jgi:hypothetical protein
LLGIELQTLGCPEEIVMVDKWRMIREELSKNLKGEEEEFVLACIW